MFENVNTKSRLVHVMSLGHHGRIAQFLLSLLLFAGANTTALAQLMWSDEFDQGTRLDETVWSYDLGAHGWGNQELQEYTNASENARIEDGNLVITVRDTDQGFTSARVRTEDKFIFKYGTIEARIKVPNLADGLWPAFWTLGNNFSTVGWPYCGEIDIMEMGSSAAMSADVINQRVGSAAHWDNNGSWSSFARYLDTGTNLNDDYHVFRMEWTPERITTYIDDRQVWTYHIQIDTCADCSEFHQPHFVILNMAVGGTYTGLLNEGQITATTPAEMLVDYVRVYDNGYTQVGGSAVYELLGAEYSGSWYNRDQSGHGFSMEFGRGSDGLSKVIVYWYVYDDQGNPLFMTGSGKLDGNRVELEFKSPVGMRFGEFDPTSVAREPGGTAIIEFSDSDTATFSYTPSEFSVNTWNHTAIDSLPLVKLFKIPVSNYQPTD